MMDILLTCSALALGAALTCGTPEVVDDAASFPEGPYVRDGVLHWVEYGGHTLERLGASGPEVVWTQDGCGPSGILPFGAGWLVTCYDAGTLVEVSAAGETVTTWDADSEGDPLLGPNDITSDGIGGAFVTASGPWETAPIVGAVYWLTPGLPAPQKLADDLHYANGIGLGPDGRLYVAESEAGRIISFAITEGPGLTDRRLFARIALVDGDSGLLPYPDGIEWGPDGNLWIGQFSSGRIVVAKPDGTAAGVLEISAPSVPNLAFSADGGTLYVTAVDDPNAEPFAGRVLAVPLR